MSEPRRWTLHEGPIGDYIEGGSIFIDGEEVMPVSEHEALLESVKLDRDSWETKNQVDNVYLLGQVDEFRESWKSRGRELNALYDVISKATEDSANGDPLEDLQAIVTERDALRKSDS